MKNITTTVQVGSYSIGNSDFVVVAGPCSIESMEQFAETAEFVKGCGAMMLRGGMFKLRTNPNTFQGMGKNAFSIAREVKEKTGMPFISEITDPRQVGDLVELVDVFQVGSRNMHNYALLKELGQVNKPVLLKRGFSGLISEWLYSAEYVAKNGNNNVILCERGIRTFETATRNTFDVNAIAYIKQNTPFPILADPSHGTGASALVTPIALAAAAAGADGIIVEVHPRPDEARSDGFQALTLPMFENLMKKLERVLTALDRKFCRPS
ncbi:MAG: 3-deoxy-7-phosphoheptulonate synthase [Bdellovibrionales bacterium RBG_16_40_8]|nr:MAG: 3-deoxy-7-phosphoheptulonate synthase [Bdellovibrionales bacterium RBG_16_40_8]